MLEPGGLGGASCQHREWENMAIVRPDAKVMSEEMTLPPSPSSKYGIRDTSLFGGPEQGTPGSGGKLGRETRLVL